MGLFGIHFPNNTNTIRQILILWWLKADGQAMGGAMLRDEGGRMVAGLRFPIQAASPLEAELRAIFYALQWVIQVGFVKLHVESDCREAILILLGKEARFWKEEFQAILLNLGNKAISFGHVKREGNWPAHYLAKEKSAQLEIFSSPRDLPISARRAYFMDFYGLPSFRFLN
ncbi:unnamed protein product [Cuscuta epithymum]|uniref:RNase H type-1 domain-containing protein n=1 Tax=Cuscuta epithymum TaxID=186058 RepID=A0AAV0E6S9_9ASTE|nr:unnamed protein product [Cuscuta epithymum]CAH9136806.1 unnamed protein product [Cuscuta epithymum]